MPDYSDKIIKKEFSDTLIKACRLSPIKSSVETVKLVKCILPSLGSLTDAALSADRSLAFATCLNLFAQNATVDHFESLQVLLLGSILDSNDEPLSSVEKINAWLESHEDISQYDLLVWLFSQNLLQPLIQSDVFKQNAGKLETVKNMFSGMFAELPKVETGVSEDEPEAAEV